MSARTIADTAAINTHPLPDQIGALMSPRESRPTPTGFPTSKTVSVSREVLQKEIKESVEQGSTIYTDCYMAYRGLKFQFNHSTVDHGAKEYVNGECHTNGIESFWALFKRGYMGVYHQMSKKHLQRYVNEFAFRFNRRSMQMQGVFTNVVDNIVKTPNLPYKTLTRDIA